MSTNNSLHILHPYKWHGQWVFDDPNTGLVREAFVMGADAILESLTRGVRGAESGFNLLFAQEPFPGHQIVLERLSGKSGGMWYWCANYSTMAWLCPALFLYFETAPERIYARAEPAQEPVRKPVSLPEGPRCYEYPPLS